MTVFSRTGEKNKVIRGDIATVVLPLANYNDSARSNINASLQILDGSTQLSWFVEETNNFVTSGGVVHNCRPPENRDPRPPEVSSCEGYLQQQIAMIRPKIILALGRIAAQNLLKIEVPIGRMRGQRYTYGKENIPVIVTYHPAYLLRSPREKRKSWQDLQLALKIYQEPR